MDTHFTSHAANGGSHHLRFHLPHRHLSPVFGNDWFALKAEAFARFFGTPFFLVGQTLVVAIWILLNAAKITHFDLYPFILLNLAFSTQAAYAAPLILLAQNPPGRPGQIALRGRRRAPRGPGARGRRAGTAGRRTNHEALGIMRQNTD